MADLTADSGFGAIHGADRTARSEPVLRGPRESSSNGEALRAERIAATRTADAAPRAGAAALAKYNAALEGPLAKARFAVWAGGGALSLALMAGIGVWGYKLVMREVLGLPVVAAEEGAMRVLPTDPGGEIVPQQGLEVNAIPAAGIAAAPSDVLVLAPQTPGLAEEDMDVVVQTMAEADEVVPVATAVALDPLGLVEAGAPEAVPEVEVASAAEPATPEPSMTAGEGLAFANDMATDAAPLAPLAEALAAPVAVALPEAAPAVAPTDAVVTAPLEAPAAEAAPAPLEGAPVEVAAAPVTVIPATVPGVAAAIRPAPRPAALRAPATAAPVVAASASPAEAEAAASASPALTDVLPAGTHLVQLGAFDSAEIAASEWERLQGPFGEFLGGKERVIQETQSNGRTLYRLRAMGFSDRSEARILCAALTAEDADCIPVTVD